jgi:DNA polymerase (family 10)
VEISNTEIAGIFNQVAELLELKAENPFKVRAYRKAADALISLDRPVRDALADAGHGIPGIGDAIRAKIEEILATGRLQYLDRLREEIPPAIFLLTEVPGIGPKAAWRLHDALGIDDVESLLSMARAGRIREVPGFGSKTEANIIRSIELMRHAGERSPLYAAIPIADRIVDELGRVPGVTRVSAAGSLRRRRDTVGDVDIVAASEDPERVMDTFASLAIFREIPARGTTKSTGITETGLSCDLRVVSPEDYWTALHHLTGSKQHHVRLRGIAGRLGLKINEYGVFREDTGEPVPIDSEEDLYAALGMSYIPPELREDTGEIEASQEGRLPNLVARSSIKGDLHTHTKWSDGVGTVLEMAQTAQRLGYEYIAVTDHSRALGIARGLDRDRLLAQVEEIRRLSRDLRGIRILAGFEVDILKDGTLDMDDEVLEQLDIVVASIHSGFRQDRHSMTERILRAVHNPNVDILAHPTGRILGYRPGYEVDLDAVIKAAAETGTAMEINSYPDRLDLSDANARAARDAGVTIVIDTDSHSPSELVNIEFGVWVARRAWLEPRDILNCLTYDDLMSRLARKKRAAVVTS